MTEDPAEPVGTVVPRWRDREPPLVPAAVAGRGAAARALATAWLADERADLVGVAGPDLLVFVGPAEALPWADGCAWLGRDPAAPGLLLPTTHRPDVPLPLYARAALARVAEGAAPLVVLRDPALIVPLGGARPLERARLLAWLAEGR